MIKIYSVLSSSLTEYQTNMLWAACNVAFFGFLIIGEMTDSNQAAFNESVHFPYRNVDIAATL